MLANLRNVDEGFAAEVADALSMPLPAASDAARPTRTDLPSSDALSILKQAKGTFKGRKLGMLVTPGADAAVVAALQSGVAKAGGVVDVIGQKIGPVTLSDGSELTPDHALAGAPSVLFDAVAIVASAEGGPLLADQPGARDFLHDAFGHFKLIGYTPGARAIFDAVALTPDEACTELSPKATGGFVKGLGRLRFWERDLSA